MEIVKVDGKYWIDIRPDKYKFYDYAMGYYNSALCLIEQSQKTEYFNNISNDVFGFVIFYSYRHMCELLLKDIIRFYSGNEKYGHYLDDLWKTAKP